jgi:hypothetical protein
LFADTAANGGVLPTVSLSPADLFGYRPEPKKASSSRKQKH